ncbi:MAG: cellulase family glycosylhydrolase, partial [Phycisphaerae bacterium]
SPAVLIATTGKLVRLHGWSARGYAAPDLAAFMSGRDVKLQAIQPGPVVAPAELRENWLLLWSSKRGKHVPRPLLVVFEKRPQEIIWTDDAAEPAGLEIRYATGGRRIGLVRPIDEPMGRRLMDDQLGHCRFWSRAMLRYPVGYAEQVAFDAKQCKVRMDYEYVELKDDWKTEPLSLAPLPMLFSYALEHNWPGAKADGDVTDLGCRARSGYYPQMDCGAYRAAVGQTHVTYRFDRVEPKRHLRGVGTLGEERRLGQEMFANLHKWGFNSSRPQIPFQSRGWDLFDQYARGGPAEKANVKLSGKGVEFLDDMIAWHRERGMTCVLNWFWDFGRGGYSDACGRQIERFWAAIAERYKDQPPHAVAYSILNEPAGLPWAVYNPFIKRVTRAIRAHDKVHAISIESGGGWAQPEDLDMTVPTGDENTIYQYHFYGPHKTEFRDNLLYPRYNRSEDRWRSYEGWEERMLSPIRFQIRHHAEVFHGEFGISHLQADGAAEGWLEDVLAIHHKYRMHWNWWHYSGSGTYRTGLVAPDHVNPLLPILRKYARKAAPR